LKTELEKEDVEVIAKKVADLLRPHLNNGKNGDQNTIFDVEDLAEYLKVSKKWVYERTHLKEIPHIKVNGVLRFSKKEIDKWLIGYKVPSVN
jgi:excisionase family DNA binding protein